MPGARSPRPPSRIDTVLGECEAVLGDLAGAAAARSAPASPARPNTSPHARSAPSAAATLASNSALAVGNRAETIAGLRDHSLDLAVMGQPPEDLAVQATIIGPHPHVVVTAGDHPSPAAASCRRLRLEAKSSWCARRAAARAA